MSATLSALLSSVVPSAEKPVVFVVGAGLSVASGIPTFRGEAGYWTVGSQIYHPQEMATQAAFSEMPREVWRWYLYRRGVCRRAAPNPAHHALAALAKDWGPKVRLITQNVDGLHLRAGHPEAFLYAVHGDIELMRCAAECTAERWPIPPTPALGADEPLDDGVWETLICRNCGGRGRPHILWFDECYEEALYRSDAAMAAAHSASVFVTVGASGAASLPIRATAAAVHAGAVLIDVNPEPNPFRKHFQGHAQGAFVAGDAGEWVPRIVELLRRPPT